MKITPLQLAEFDAEFSRGELWMHQRYGQAFCNAFSAQDSTLFYAVNYYDARKRVEEVYVDYTKNEETKNGN